VIDLYDSILSKDLLIIIPVHNEEDSIGQVLRSLKEKITTNIIVVDNASTDNSSEIVTKEGVKVIFESQIGYGSACLAGINHLLIKKLNPKFVCFFDGDGQSLVEDIFKIGEPVFSGRVNYSQGTRMKIEKARSSLSTLAIVANRYFAILLSFIFGQKISDLGPLRVLKWETLQGLNMQSCGYGWTIEMTTKILKSQLPLIEIPVSYNPRISGKSKISGRLWPSIKAAMSMNLTFLKILLFWSPNDVKN
jgi:glycosyltransferase involved in cell wall biosynthesis